MTHAPDCAKRNVPLCHARQPHTRASMKRSRSFLYRSRDTMAQPARISTTVPAQCAARCGTCQCTIEPLAWYSVALRDFVRGSGARLAGASACVYFCCTECMRAYCSARPVLSLPPGFYLS